MLGTHRREADEGAEGLDAAEIPNPKKRRGCNEKGIHCGQKSLLRELNINVNKSDGPAANSLFEKLKVTVNRRGKVNGAEGRPKSTATVNGGGEPKSSFKRVRD